MTNSLLQKAQRALAIQDVYVCDASAWADRENDPGVMTQNLNAQFKISPTNQCQLVQVEPPVEGMKFIVRYFIGTGLRILKPGIDANRTDIPREELVADIEATFIVRYVVASDDAPTQEMLEAFNDNAVHHIWPYWREFLQATTVRLRVPPVILPMRVVAPNSVTGQAPSGPSE